MPEPTEVAIIKRNGSMSLYTSYGNAIANAISGDLIQIRADLNEKIILKDKVDIWIMPGVVVSNSSGDTITDIDIVESPGVHCKIYGEGIIKNTGGYSCVFIDHSDSELLMECDYVEGTSNSSNTFRSINIFRGNKFHLTCNKVISKSVAIQLGSFVSSVFNVIQDVNINVNKVETGDPTSTIVATSIVTYANGFINIDEILCKNRGHCLLHIAGSVLARIKKSTTIRVNSNFESAINIGQGGQANGTEELVMYFDEISSLGAFSGIIVGEGTGIFIGRRIFSDNASGVDISEAINATLPTKAYVKCNEIISENSWGVRLHSNNEQITIDCNYIEGNSIGGAFYAQDDANVLLKNAKLKNNYTSDPRCIVLEKTDIDIPNLTLNNVKAVTTSSGSIIFMAGFSAVTVKNFGLFANKALDSGVSLAIGNARNHLFVNSPDLT